MGKYTVEKVEIQFNLCKVYFVASCSPFMAQEAKTRPVG